MVFADWVEACALLDDPILFDEDVLDVLIEQQIYDDQDFCREWISDVWSELRRRKRAMPASPLSFGPRGRIDTANWTDYPAYTFCVVVSLLPQYSGTHEHFGADYTQQGELFERLALAGLLSEWPNWQGVRTGWSKSKPEKLVDVIQNVMSNLREEISHPDRWAPDSGNEAGLDILMWRPYLDDRPGPRYFVQAASGSNWTTKLKSPDLGLWAKFVDFWQPPIRAMVIPFCLSEKDFRIRCIGVEGNLLDRPRVMGPKLESDWVDPILANDLREWLKPRIDWLLTSPISVAS